MTDKPRDEEAENRKVKKAVAAALKKYANLHAEVRRVERLVAVQKAK